MLLSRREVEMKLTPTTAYFLAELNHLFDDEKLPENACKRAAQEYVRDADHGQTPCDKYFVAITTAQGCIAFDDQLDEVEKAPVSHGIMAGNFLASKLEKDARNHMAEFTLAKMSEEEKEFWRRNIKTCNEEWLQKREAKLNQFADTVVTYVANGKVPNNKKADTLSYKFRNLEDGERKIVEDKVNVFLTNLKSDGYSTGMFSKSNTKQGVEARAEKFTSQTRDLKQSFHQ